MEKRSSGILLPVSSLPSPYGVGTLGKPAYEFVDFLKKAGQSWWQVLPIGPTSYGDSPYQSFSCMAGNPYFIDLDELIEDRLLLRSEVESASWGEDPQFVDYGTVYQSRFPVLRRAAARGMARDAEDFLRFRHENPWVENYALFMAVKRHFDMQCWTDWPDEGIRLHKKEAVAEYGEKLKDEVDFWVFLQVLFFRQWETLRAYAHEKGVQFIGDIPIYVALDSADVWSEPKYFQLDGENLPTEVAGCPPDAFTEDGQLWGNPLYDWDAMKADGYGWWIRRIDGAKELFDVIRIDHFRGFESYCAVPYGDANARRGVWKKGPGMDLIGMLRSWFHGLEFIAEDLGYTTPEVEKLLSDSGFPGMKILEFGFDADGDAPYMPHNCKENSVCYIGTHDNETVKGWLKTNKKKHLRFAERYMRITEEEGWCWGMIRTGMGTASKLFVMQMQDILELPASARMNAPGTVGSNWQWRMKPDALTKELAKKLREYTHTYRRC